ncbi:MAG: flagellar biosynthesis regulator FlaF [Parvularculaceae bacterium]|nr:flagellar biosynthesis regulator FlaF [Parvularculaceae bacterium]
MSHDAYARAQKTTAHPRDAEYKAFAEATRKLMAVAAEGRDDLKQLIDAVHLNRSLWSALATDCADAHNQLPSETRALIISLARWVSLYSSDVMRKKDSVEPLIDVNRIIMDGLSGKRPAA